MAALWRLTKHHYTPPQIVGQSEDSASISILQRYNVTNSYHVTMAGVLRNAESTHSEMLLRKVPTDSTSKHRQDESFFDMLMRCQVGIHIVDIFITIRCFILLVFSLCSICHAAVAQHHCDCLMHRSWHHIGLIQFAVVLQQCLYLVRLIILFL